MFEGATEPRGSVWSARSLLPLWRVGRQRCSLSGSIPASKSEMLPEPIAASHRIGGLRRRLFRSITKLHWSPSIAHRSSEGCGLTVLCYVAQIMALDDFLLEAEDKMIKTEQVVIN